MKASGTTQVPPERPAVACCIVDEFLRPRYTDSAMPEQLLQRLTELGIGHRTFEHPPVLTVGEARRHAAHLPGGHWKSLFLKEEQDGLWLLVCLYFPTDLPHKRK